MKIGAAAGILIAMLVAGCVVPQLPAEDSHARDFSVDWELHKAATGPSLLDGYVYNRSRVTAVRVKLLVDALDAAGASQQQSVVTVSGDLPPGSQRYWSTRQAPVASTYRVTVQTVDLR